MFEQSQTQNPGAITFPDAGVYTISLTVTDDAGQSVTSPEVEVTVIEKPPFPKAVILSPTGAAQIYVGGVVNFAGADQDDLTQGVSYLWEAVKL